MSALLAVPVVWFVSRGDFGAFAWHTFGYFSTMLSDHIAGQSFPAGSMSLTPWLAAALGAEGVRAVNAAAQLALLVVFAVIALASLPRSSRSSPHRFSS